MQVVALSDFSSSNNLFNFTLTWTYLNYTSTTSSSSNETVNAVKTIKMIICEKVVDAIFGSTIVGSISNLLNSKSSNVNVSVGWYLSSCKSNIYNQINNLTDPTNQANSITSNDYNSVNDQNDNITVNDNNSNNQQNKKISINNGGGTINDNGKINNLQSATSYLNPSTITY